MNADVVAGFIAALSDWKDKYLLKVGVPSNFEADWDFVSVVSACKFFPLPSKAFIDCMKAPAMQRIRSCGFYCLMLWTTSGSAKSMRSSAQAALPMQCPMNSTSLPNARLLTKPFIVHCALPVW
jgi:hypothetical protein